MLQQNEAQQEVMVISHINIENKFISVIVMLWFYFCSPSLHPSIQSLQYTFFFIHFGISNLFSALQSLFEVAVRYSQLRCSFRMWSVAACNIITLCSLWVRHRLLSHPFSCPHCLNWFLHELKSVHWNHEITECILVGYISINHPFTCSIF